MRAAQYSKQESSHLAPVALLMHQSDYQVKPLVGNRLIEVIEMPNFKEAALPCPALDMDEILQVVFSFAVHVFTVCIEVYLYLVSFSKYVFPTAFTK